MAQAKGRIQIMAGSGVNGGNAHLFSEIGTDAIHFSIRKKRNSIGSLSMGANYDVDEEKITAIIKALKEWMAIDISSRPRHLMRARFPFENEGVDSVRSKRKTG